MSDYPTPLSEVLGRVRKMAQGRYTEPEPECRLCEDTGWQWVPFEKNTVRRCLNGCAIPPAGHWMTPKVEKYQPGNF